MLLHDLFVKMVHYIIYINKIIGIHDQYIIDSSLASIFYVIIYTFIHIICYYYIKYRKNHCTKVQYK